MALRAVYSELYCPLCMHAVNEHTALSVITKACSLNVCVDNATISSHLTECYGVC